MAAAFDSGAFDSGAFEINGGGAVTPSGSIAWTEDNDVLASSGSVTVTGSAAWAEDADTAALSGSVTAGQSGSIAWTEDSDTAALAGSLSVTGLASWAEDADGAAIAGAVTGPATGSIAWTEADDGADIVGNSEATPTVSHGFIMVDIEPSWKKALRLRAEAKAAKVQLKNRKDKKRAELLEKIAAKEALSNKPQPVIEERLKALLQEWVELAPTIEVESIPEMDGKQLDAAYLAFMQQVADRIRRMQDEDDEEAIVALLLL